ncbi:hypothetical protein RJ639_013605 [Escallonia herrerae]|uniref:Uncharacterized protein n=1 Tax=Escallonia herrerae TaxID=1293975 RepID=A0AA88VI03_9ASTE|nr:hypothetical protein RJ639_013605 [Escallonia herrerae]
MSYPAYVDRIISAKIPNENEDVVGYNVMKHKTYVEEKFRVYKRHDDGRVIIAKDDIPLDNINMRLQKKTRQDHGGMSPEEFSKWIIDHGDGKLTTYSVENEFDPTWIKFPIEFSYSTQ